MKKKTKQRIIGAAIFAVLAVGIGAAIYYGTRLGSTVTTPGTFSVIVVDPLRGNEGLDERDFDCQLYSLPEGEDATDWSAWELHATIDQVSDIDEDDLDTDEYSRFVVIYNGTTDTVHDDLTGVVYYARQAEIFVGRLNTLYAYETPNAGAAMLSFYSTNGTVITWASKNITSTAATNFSIMVVTNITQTHAAYAAYWDYSANDWARLSINIGFNTTCSASELSGNGGLVRTHPTASSLLFSWNYLGREPVIFDFEWRTTPTADIEIDGGTIAVQFNGVAI